MSQNKYYYTAERKAEHEYEVGSKWHYERNKAIRKEQLAAHFAAGGTQCSNPDCGMLFAPDDSDKYRTELQSKLTAAQAEIAKLQSALDVAVEALGSTWPNMFPEIRQHHKEALDKIKQIRE